MEVINNEQYNQNELKNINEVFQHLLVVVSNSE